MKNTSPGSTGHKPDIRLTLCCNTGSAGGKCAFAFLCGGKAGLIEQLPLFAAVLGRDELELAVNRVAQGDAMVSIPEGHAVEESFWVMVGELKLPVRAGIRRTIDL